MLATEMLDKVLNALPALELPPVEPRRWTRGKLQTNHVVYFCYVVFNTVYYCYVA